MASSRRLRILQVCSASQAIYGAVQSLLALANAQREAGHTVEFVTFKGKEFGAQVRELGFAVHEVRVRTKIDPLAILRMRRLMKDGKYDVVHTHLSTSSVNGCLAARAAGLPSVATVHGMSGKLSFAAATHLIAVSEEIKRHMVSQGVKPTSVSVVYNGYEPPDRAAHGKTEDDRFPVLGTVARVTPMKGIEDAIRAVAILKADFPDVSYLVVGDGVGVEPCKQLAAELGVGDRVHFVGYRNDIDRFLARMDLFVFPSLKEGMGIALVEAMAQGLATVATNVGGIPEVITPECGLLVPARSPEVLAARVSELLRDTGRREAMGRAARHRAATVFSIEAMEKGTDAVYRGLLVGV